MNSTQPRTHWHKVQQKLKEYLKACGPLLTIEDLESLSHDDRVSVGHYISEDPESAYGLVSSSSQIAVLLDIHCGLSLPANEIGKAMRCMALEDPDYIWQSRAPGTGRRAWVIAPWWKVNDE